MSRTAGEGTIYRRKDGRYEAAAYVTTVTGIRKRVRLYAPTAQLAQTKLRAALTKRDNGIRAADQAWTVGAYLDYWLENFVKTMRRPRTYILYRQLIRDYLKPALGTKRLDHLTVTDLQRYFNAALANGQSIRTVQKQRVALSAALTRAMREELVPRNPARLVELPTWHRQPITPWTVEQASRFLTTAQADPLYPAFVLLALYGLRSGEVLGLSWDDIDFDARLIHIRQQLQRYEGTFHLDPLKTHAGQRDLPLLVMARGALLAHRVNQVGHYKNLVFTTRFDNPIESSNLRRSLRRLCDTAAVPVLKPHHLRHTAATLLKNMGVPDRDIQLILGHASVLTTQQIYQHGDLASQRAGLAKVERSLLSIGDSGRSRQAEPLSASFLSALPVLASRGPGAPFKPRVAGSNPAGPSNEGSLTAVAEFVLARTRRLLVGIAAVKSSRQTTPLITTSEPRLTAAARLYRTARETYRTADHGITA